MTTSPHYRRQTRGQERHGHVLKCGPLTIEASSATLNLGENLL